MAPQPPQPDVGATNDAATSNDDVRASNDDGERGGSGGGGDAQANPAAAPAAGKPLPPAGPPQPSSVRDHGLGEAWVLSDSLVLRVLSLLTVDELLVVQRVSKALYVFANEPRLWKAPALCDVKGDFYYMHTWKHTCLWNRRHRLHRIDACILDDADYKRTAAEKKAAHKRVKHAERDRLAASADAVDKLRALLVDYRREHGLCAALDKSSINADDDNSNSNNNSDDDNNNNNNNSDDSKTTTTTATTTTATTTTTTATDDSGDGSDDDERAAALRAQLVAAERAHAAVESEVNDAQERRWLARELEKRRNVDRWLDRPLSDLPEAPSSPPPPALVVHGFFSQKLYRRWYRSHVDLGYFRDVPAGRPQVARTAGYLMPSGVRKSDDAVARNIAHFREHFDRRDNAQPCIVEGIMADWPCYRDGTWQRDRLIERFSTLRWRMDEVDVNGKKLRMTLRNYFRYCATSSDEDPIYWFDARFGEKAPELLNDYRVPEYFVDGDYMAALGETRPNFRWIVVGPPRSGSAWHIDPVGTSAWNALVSGRKRWALYPPDRVPPGIWFQHAVTGEKQYQAHHPLRWFLEVYPRLLPCDAPIEIVQRPGDVIFVPSGWWHCVLNIEESVAVTQNFASSTNLAAVWYEMSIASAPKLRRVFERAMRAHHPDEFADACRRAEEMRRRDADEAEEWCGWTLRSTKEDRRRAREQQQQQQEQEQQQQQQQPAQPQQQRTTNDASEKRPIASLQALE